MPGRAAPHVRSFPLHQRESLRQRIFGCNQRNSAFSPATSRGFAAHCVMSVNIDPDTRIVDLYASEPHAHPAAMFAPVRHAHGT